MAPNGVFEASERGIGGVGAAVHRPTFVGVWVARRAGIMASLSTRNRENGNWPNWASPNSEVHRSGGLSYSYPTRCPTCKPLSARSRWCMCPFWHLCAEIRFFSTFLLAEMLIPQPGIVRYMGLAVSSIQAGVGPELGRLSGLERDGAPTANSYQNIYFCFF